ncbi:unnamed protein product [Vitrella brassicaformis CCMP3155]|uniref:Uncharacterized protein n=1 Tax=Vitrella brassicaformis (strain CCMP3155) TaxID=1169540 RepID=A0A0G4GVY8_VITBC|nr:unnamed protein product [Vitrella brassicaformis CCMP3155]|eukprot:CEM35131.1 unnamed protein product [Vitrella brassicaformis CCMP3155]
MGGSGDLEDLSGHTTAPGTMISKLCTDASLLREGLQRLQRDAQQSCETYQRDGGGLAKALLSSVVSQVFAAEASMAGAMDSLTTMAAMALPQPADDTGASSAAAAAAAVAIAVSQEEPNAESSAMVDEAAAPTPSFRLVHKSGNPPPNTGPPSFRLSRDELACVFGFYQPSELTQVAPTLRKTLFGWAAQQYTHLTIDGSDKGGVRQQWERMPLEVAHRWGRRATNLTHLHVIYPRGTSRWCRGTWVALIEGNAEARKATKEKREEEQGESGAAAAASAAARGQDHASAASSIKVLSFEEDSDGEPNCEANDVSSDPLPPSPSPVDLSALEEVHNLPYGCAEVRTSDRVWQTPSVRVMTFEWDDTPDPERAIGEWMASCEHLEIFDDDGTFETKAELLCMPPPGTSLARLRSIGPIFLQYGEADDYQDRVAGLRQALVARGCRKSLRELSIEASEITAENKGLLREVALLSEAVLHPEALSEAPVVKLTHGREMEVELIEWMANESPQVQKLVRELASVAEVVSYNNELTDPNAAAHATVFPCATTFRCTAGELSAEEIDGLAKTVASSMPQCRTIHLGDADEDALKHAVAFLRSLRRHMATEDGQGGGEGEGEKHLSVTIAVSVTGILHRSLPLQLWPNRDLPAIDDVFIRVMGSLPPGATEEALYGSLMASLTGVMSRPGVSKASAWLCHSVLKGVRRLFNTHLAAFNLLGAPYTITMRYDTITIARRT